MRKMIQAARLAAFGEGWVMPMVLMMSFEMRRRNFMLFRCCPHGIGAETAHVFEGEFWKGLAHPLSIVRFAEGLPQR
jgi:hypothetical protein